MAIFVYLSQDVVLPTLETIAGQEPVGLRMILHGNCSMRCSTSCIPSVVRRWVSGPNRPDFWLR